MMRVLNWLVVFLLLSTMTFLGLFWLGSKNDYDLLMQAGVVQVFFERAGGISLFGLGLALPWWLLNWLLVKYMDLKPINLKALALQLSIAAVAGAVCGTTLFCWH